MTAETSRLRLGKYRYAVARDTPASAAISATETSPRCFIRRIPLSSNWRYVRARTRPEGGGGALDAIVRGDFLDT